MDKTFKFADRSGAPRGPLPFFLTLVCALTLIGLLFGALLSGCAPTQPLAANSGATPTALEKTLSDIEVFNDGAVTDFNSPAGQNLINTVVGGVANVMADAATGNDLGAGVAGGNALAGVLVDAAQLPTTGAQLAQVNAVGAKISTAAAKAAPQIAKIIQAAAKKTSNSANAAALLQAAAKAVAASKIAAPVRAAVQVAKIGEAP